MPMLNRLGGKALENGGWIIYFDAFSSRIKHYNEKTNHFSHHLYFITSYAQTDPREAELLRLENIEREA